MSTEYDEWRADYSVKASEEINYKAAFEAGREIGIYNYEGIEYDLEKIIEFCLKNPDKVDVYIQLNYPKEYRQYKK